MGHICQSASFSRYGATLGGFDISGNTPRCSWQAIAFLGYDVSETVSIAGGFRGLSADARDEKPLFTDKVDLSFSGPVLGAAFRF